MDTLAALVIHTAINADREVSRLLSSGDYEGGITSRLKQIKKIRQLAQQKGNPK